MTAVPKLEVGGRDGWMDEKKTLPCAIVVYKTLCHIFSIKPSKEFSGEIIYL